MLALLDEIFHPPPSSKNTPVSKPTFKRVTKKPLFDVDVVPAESTGKGVFFSTRKWMHFKVWKIWGIWLWVRFAKGVLHGKPLSLSPLMATHSHLASLSCSQHTLSWRHQNRNSVGSMLCGCPTSFCWNLKEMVSKQKKQVHVTYSGRLPSAFHLDLLLKKKTAQANLSILILWCYGRKKNQGNVRHASAPIATCFLDDLTTNVLWSRFRQKMEDFSDGFGLLASKWCPPASSRFARSDRTHQCLAAINEATSLLSFPSECSTMCEDCWEIIQTFFKPTSETLPPKIKSPCWPPLPLLRLNVTINKQVSPLELR